MKLNVERPSISRISLAVIVTGLAVAGIHIYHIPVEFLNDASGYGILFTLSGAGGLAALAAMYLPWSWLTPLRALARFMLVGATLTSIIVYLVLGFYDVLGWVTKVLEVVLIYAAVREAVTSPSDVRSTQALAAS